MSESFERDVVIERVREALQRDLDKADPRAAARVLQAVWASPRPSLWRRAVDVMRVPTFTRAGAMALAGVALLVGAFMPDVTKPDGTGGPVAPVAASATAPAGAVEAIPASDEVNGVVAVRTQFVLEHARARQVSLVGDFNDWKTGVTPLVRLADGMWTTTVPLPPGRHVYAFVIDDTLLMADPRAPKAGDADYGREGSVVMVFAP